MYRPGAKALAVQADLAPEDHHLGRLLDRQWRRRPGRRAGRSARREDRFHRKKVVSPLARGHRSELVIMLHDTPGTALAHHLGGHSERGGDRRTLGTAVPQQVLPQPLQDRVLRGWELSHAKAVHVASGSGSSVPSAPRKRKGPHPPCTETAPSLSVSATARLQDERLGVRRSLTCTCSRESRKRKSGEKETPTMRSDFQRGPAGDRTHRKGIPWQ